MHAAADQVIDMRDQLARDIESELVVLPKLIGVQCAGSRDFQLFLDVSRSAGTAPAVAACRGLLLVPILVELILLPLQCALP